MPCEACLVPNDKLLDITRAPQQPRTDTLHRDLLRRASALPDMKESAALLAAHSMQPVIGALVVFAGNETAHGSSLQAFGFDSLHNEGIGVCKYFVKHLPAIFAARLASGRKQHWQQVAGAVQQEAGFDATLRAQQATLPQQ